MRIFMNIIIVIFVNISHYTVPLSAPELSFGPFSCFLQSESSFVTCSAQSFPDPTITLIHNNNELVGGILNLNPFTGLATYTITIGNSMTDAGRYTCEARSNGDLISANLDTQFCRE